MAHAETGPADAEPLAELEAAAKANRRDADAQRAYGHALLRAGRYREAERALKAAARLSSNSAESLYDIARIAFAQNDYRAARRACGAMRRKHRGDVLTHVCMARAFLVWNRSARAFEELEAALEQDPDHFEALLAKGDAHRLRADVDAAEVAYRKAAAAAPKDARPHLGLGRLYQAVGRRQEAVAALRAAYELDPESPAVLYQLGRLEPGADGVAMLEKAVASRPDWADPHAALGTARLRRGDAEEAAKEFRRAIEENEDLAPAHSGLGRALVALGKHDEAEASLKRGLELVPNASRAQLALARLYEATDRSEEALEQYRATADTDPSDPEPLLSAARLALTLKRDVLAAGYLDRLLERHPRLARGLALYGDVMRARGMRDEARQYYRKALDEGRGELDREQVTQALAALDEPESSGEELQPAVVAPN